MPRLVPCKEAAPNLPEMRKPSKPVVPYTTDQLFAFDTETTVDGVKELGSYQSAHYEGDVLVIHMYALEGWYEDKWKELIHHRLSHILRKDVKFVKVISKEWKTVDALRKNAQILHETLMYGDAPRLVKTKKGNWRRSKRQVERCAVAFNGNFDYGRLADDTELVDEMTVGIMEGQGVKYRFTSCDRKQGDSKYGLRIDALYLGADSIPYTANRGELWELASPCKYVWGCASLKMVGRHIGIEKLDADFNDSAYGAIDAVITLRAAIQMTDDMERMGFTGAPDRFVSGATASKDKMRQTYSPFYLEQDQHDLVWPAYFGGMTGAVIPDVVKDSVGDVVYGDLDGAYNVSGQNLGVFKWSGCEWVDADFACKVVKIVQDDPSRYWEYGSLHLRVTGTFNRCPIRVAVVGDSPESVPSKSQGLVWARMENYSTTLTLGDFLMSQPENYVIHEAVMAVSEGNSPCLFKWSADERAKVPKKVDPVLNGWYKLVGNCIYGVFANRNGKHRTESGPFFNALIASSITGAIRYCIHTVNEACHPHSYYNDTDSALIRADKMGDAVKALEPLNIGFSNKTDDELPVDVAQFAIIHGSKRYCMMGADGSFGAKVHGLGSWFTFVDGRVRSIAHYEPLVRTVWSCAYPDELGLPDNELKVLPVFHKFSIKSRRISNLIGDYALRQGVGLADVWKYMKAGNFGYTTPTLVDGKVVPVACFDSMEAMELSDLTLEEIAFAWSESKDKKFDYQTGNRWKWTGNQIVEVDPVSHTQQLQAKMDGDISIEGRRGKSRRMVN